GNQTRLGATGSIEVEISDATHRYAEHPTYTFESRTQTFEQPYQCYNSYWCRESTWSQMQKWGGATSPGY
ncbi:MAG TPA: hypothetical protein VF787_17250, partial [Thermoanaerobaculia bacterium]